MGQVIGPFSKNDFYTMKQLKLDLAFNRKHCKEEENFDIAERYIRNKLRNYMTREAA